MSGYYTSRPGLKGYIRECAALFHAARQVQLLTAPPAAANASADPLFALDAAIATSLHHDAITGTEYDDVAADYTKMLAAGRSAASTVVLGGGIAALTGYGAATDWATCDLVNVTRCPALEAPAVGRSVVVAVWNAQSTPRNVTLRLPVALPAGVHSYAVVGPSGAPITAQFLPISPEDAYLRSIYGGAAAVPMSWLAFMAPDVPAVGYITCFITPAASAAEAPDTHASTVATWAPVLGSGSSEAAPVLTNGVITLTFDAATGALTGYANAATGVRVPLSQDWAWYNG
jgi:hypothetical protein